MDQNFNTFVIRYIALVYIAVLQERLRVQRVQFVTGRQSILLHRDSPAALVLAQRETGAFMSHFGLDPRSIDILHRLFDSMYPPPPRTGRPRQLSSQAVLAATLLWFHTTTKQELIGSIFGVMVATINRAINKGIDILDELFRTVNDRRWRIRWPSTRKMQSFARMIQFREPMLEGVFGFVDGLNLKIQEPGDVNTQNAYYNGWKSACFASQVIVFTPDGRICWMK